MTLVPLVVVIPMAGAAAIAAFGHFVPSRLANLAALGCAGAVTVLSVLLIFRSADHTLHYWFGGWHPRGGIAIGISFSVDPLGAALAALAGVLACAALVQTLGYFDEAVPSQFHVLMLVFLGAMAGFALSSDLFNIFVFFELTSTAAVALTAYRIEYRSVLQGALNFAVVNAVGALFVLIGIGLVYARTGALNLAQIGQVLARHDADGLVLVAFALLVAGFLTKAGAVPFHFWLSDAYAVAPAPVCILFAGIMSDLGLHAVARVYWTGFSGALDAEAVRAILVAVGLATALVGAVMAFVQSSLKRMLAFVVVSHVGVFLCGFGLLSARGVAAATVYVIADGLVKGAIFCAVTDLGRRTGHTDELLLRGRGRGLRVSGAVVALGALGLAALPPLATFVPLGLLQRGAGVVGYGWLPPFLVAATALTGAAVLRAAGRIFLGFGPERDAALVTSDVGEEAEGDRRSGRGGPLLWAPAVLLLLAGACAAFAPGVPGQAIRHAERFVDRPALAAETLHGVPAPLPPLPGVAVSGGSLAYALASGLGAILVAWLALRRPLPALGRPFARLKLLHDGVVGDYVTWTVFGTALLAAVVAVFAR